MKLKNTSDYIAFNSYGGFTPSKDEYHILNTNTPLPWCNVMANEHFGTVVSSYGTVYTYFKNSSEFKLTNWCNDWISFNPGEKFTGIFEKDYNLVYGFGYTKVLEEKDMISKNMTIFVSYEENVKFQNITLENTSDEEKEVFITYQIDPVLGVTKDKNMQYVLCRQREQIMEFKNPYSISFADCIAFITVIHENEEKIIVSYDTEKNSVTLAIKVPANAKQQCCILFGATDKGQEEIDLMTEKFNTIAKIEEEYKKTKQYWRSKVVRNLPLQDEYTSIMANGWLLYQTIVCRLFARSAFYQSGGALGFRDQLQDTLALISSWPEKTRSQIILHSSKQFEKGDVLHWWHEHNNAGIRTHFSDDYLWLPYVLSEYIERTKDYSVLEVKTPYLEDKDMNGKRELYDVFKSITLEDSVYEHAKRAILYGLSRINEKNGLLDIGDGDWNDGFSSIRGQSVWLTLFMMEVLRKFSPIAAIQKDEEMQKICEKERHVFKYNIVANAWDGDHFVRAFFENGDVLGANSNKECKIDLISQAWAVIAMIEYPDVRGELELSIKSAEKYLVDDEHLIVKLLYPAFDKPKNDPGYIKAYVPGTRENGGQYTHAATWLAKAYFELNDKENGEKILKYINPIYHADTKEKADIYMVEPYVVAADIYANPNHIGRGGWTWYTGSSSWMYKVIEDYLGRKNGIIK